MDVRRPAHPSILSSCSEMNDFYVYPPSAFTIFVYAMLLAGTALAWCIFQVLTAEADALKARLRRVSYNLQLAELQTGVPYFTACGVPNAECESGSTVYAQLQERVANTVFLPAAAPSTPPSSRSVFQEPNPLRMRTRGLTAK